MTKRIKDATTHAESVDSRALRAIYDEAASDPLFQEDNAAIQADLAALDKCSRPGDRFS